MGLGPSSVRLSPYIPFFFLQHGAIAFTSPWLARFFSFHHPLVRIYKTLNSEPATFPPYWAFFGMPEYNDDHG